MILHLQRFSAALILVATLFCLYWSVRLGWANWLNEKRILQTNIKSVELAPGNSDYIASVAEQLELSGEDGSAYRRRAVTVNPLDSGNWIRLATAAEMRNQFQEAERDLLQAFKVDRQFEPRWALANYYLRRGETARSLDWARKTLEFGGGNLYAVFQLCWNATANGDEILDKVIPRRTEVLVQYLQYLDGIGKLDYASQAVRELLPIADVEQRPAVMNHCGRCLDANRVDDALVAWNGLIDRKLTDADRIDPEAGRSLVNANFSREITGLGFDWRIPRIDGIVVEQLANGSGIRVIFSRNEPENCSILAQYVALIPHRRYRFRFQYEASSMGVAGTRWVVYDATTKSVLLTAALTGQTEGEHTMETQFQTLSRTRLARIELRYDREPGTVRPEGSTRFSHLELGFAQ